MVGYIADQSLYVGSSDGRLQRAGSDAPQRLLMRPSSPRRRTSKPSNAGRRIALCIEKHGRASAHHPCYEERVSYRFNDQQIEDIQMVGIPGYSPNRPV